MSIKSENERKQREDEHALRIMRDQERRRTIVSQVAPILVAVSESDWATVAELYDALPQESMWDAPVTAHSVLTHQLTGRYGWNWAHASFHRHVAYGRSLRVSA